MKGDVITMENIVYLWYKHRDRYVDVIGGVSPTKEIAEQHVREYAHSFEGVNQMSEEEYNYKFGNNVQPFELK